MLCLLVTGGDCDDQQGLNLHQTKISFKNGSVLTFRRPVCQIIKAVRFRFNAAVNRNCTQFIGTPYVSYPVLSFQIKSLLIY